MSTRYAAGEVLLASLFFTTQLGLKKRPVLVMHDGGDNDLLVAPVTSQSGRSVDDIRLHDWKQAGLRLPSIARLNKLATIEKSTVVRSLGMVTIGDRSRLKAALEQVFRVVLTNW